MRLHHIGIAATDMERTKQRLLKMYPDAEVGDIIYDPLQETSLCLFKISDGTIFEIVCGEKVKKIARSGFNVYHVCMETDDFDGTMEQWLQNGFDLIVEPKPAVLFDGRRVAFWRTEMGLVELLEAARG